MTGSSPPLRPSFRRRLVVTLGAALALALTVLAALVWAGFLTWSTYAAYETLDHETREIASQIVPDQTLEVDAYSWDEPHHRFIGQHVDPYFVQVFDAGRRLVHQSDNITLFAPQSYPDRLLAFVPDEPGLLPRLRTFEVEDETLYHITRPLTNADGETVGFLQVARTEPGLAALMWRLGIGLLAGLLLTLVALGALIWWQAGRVLRPLDSITDAAREITPGRLHQRIPVPEGADRETAQLASTLNDQLQRLEQAFDEMHRFTANAAHQLKTPLTVLRGHVEIALRRPRDPAAYRETLRVVARETEELTRMVQSLLMLARLDRETEALAFEPVDVEALVRREVEDLQERAARKGIALEVDAREAPPAYGQPDLLREVILNLLDNAIKYTEQGHVCVHIRPEGEQLLVQVTDSGIGMDDEVLSRVRDRFYRAPSADASEAPGCGLGLSLVDEIVARHGGEFRIESSPAEGTCVTLLLPAATERIFA